MDKNVGSSGAVTPRLVLFGAQDVDTTLSPEKRGTGPSLDPRGPSQSLVVAPRARGMVAWTALRTMSVFQYSQEPQRPTE